MHQPEFWRAEGRRAPMLQALAAPLSALYAGATATKLRRARPARAGVPVVCVGNVTVGGVGKTPIVRTVAAHLRARGVAAHVLSRGYGGAARGPLRVDPERHSAAEVGDEPLLHARDGPAWIARDRVAGARAAVAGGAQAIVMDDGFQNPSLAKDISLLVFDAEMGLGNARVLPAGPLREPLAAALARADAAVLVGAGVAPWLDAFRGPVLRAQIAPLAAPPAGKLVAFAGIGRPEKFFETLRAMGADAEGVPFTDHHRYTRGDLSFLTRLAHERGAHLITTEKDYVRLPPQARADVAALPVAARFADEEALARLLAPVAAR